MATSPQQPEESIFYLAASKLSRRANHALLDAQKSLSHKRYSEALLAVHVLGNEVRDLNRMLRRCHEEGK